jgi:hypothetical protein
MSEQPCLTTDLASPSNVLAAILKEQLDSGAFEGIGGCRRQEAWGEEIYSEKQPPGTVRCQFL